MSTSHPPRRFATTHWSLVAQAARRSSPEAEQALADVAITRQAYLLFRAVGGIDGLERAIS